MKVKADRFRGQVYLDNQEPRHPIANASVILSKTTEGNRVTIVELFTDKDGRFADDGIRPGKYLLEVRAHEYLDSIFTEMKLVSKGTGRRSSFLEIKVGISRLSESDSCEGDVTVSRRANR